MIPARLMARNVLPSPEMVLEILIILDFFHLEISYTIYYLIAGFGRKFLVPIG